MFGRLIWTVLLAAAGYVAWRVLRGDQQPPVMHQPITPQRTTPSIVVPPVADSSSQAPDTGTSTPTGPIVAEASAADSSADTSQAASPVAEAQAEADAGVEIEAYCMRCRTRRIIGGARPEKTANGRHGMRGSCTVCGTNVFTFVKEK